MTSLALLLIGYSVCSALLLAFTHFRASRYLEQTLSRAMGLVLLAALGGLQLLHFAWLQWDVDGVHSPLYSVLLFLVAPAFFLFSQPLLAPKEATGRPGAPWWHAIPVAAAAVLPWPVALSLAFVLGAGYLVWLARSLYRLRAERSGYRLELALLGIVFAIAVAVALLGQFHGLLPGKLFFALYAVSIGTAFFLVQLTLALRPALTEEVRQTVQTAYASTTLNSVDCEATLARLHELMRGERAYTDAGLSLPRLSERLGLTTHQLSELINTRLGKGFSRYLREQRVDAAKAMLCAKPSASVLSVGLAVGFTSQSNFYEAFREIEGMTPGQYRKLHAGRCI
ncbi:MAG: helix-turn-helix domain-containing protein [Burkholderiaceae bacterium]|nr:helix-turn-helix domain-containing protein [Burkholderiaceae bacterium]